MDREDLAHELVDLGFVRINLKEAAEEVGVPYYTLKSVLNGKRRCPQWIVDRVMVYRGRTASTRRR